MKMSFWTLILNSPAIQVARIIHAMLRPRELTADFLTQAARRLGARPDNKPPTLPFRAESLARKPGTSRPQSEQSQPCDSECAGLRSTVDRRAVQAGRGRRHI